METTFTASTAKSRMPAALWALTISAFGIGTTEFVIVGLLPVIAGNLGVSIPSAGALVSYYAIGVAIGAPVLTALTNRFPRKQLLISLMILFIAGNTAAAYAPGYLLLALARVITGFAHGVFFSTGATIAAAIVTPDKRASAIALMFAGLTVAMVTGVPLGTLIGQSLGWRATFMGVAALGFIGLLANILLLPEQIRQEKTGHWKEQLQVIRNKQLLIALLTTVLNYTGVFLVFTYISPLLTQITGISASLVSLVLLIYGVAVAIGNISGGVIANKNPLAALRNILLLQALILFIFTFTVHHTIPAVMTLFIIGALSFATVPASQLYVVQTATAVAPATVNVASALNIAAFNAGAAIGAWAGGYIIASDAGPGATPWVGALCLLLAAGTTLPAFSTLKK
ncbi:MFS transporter [Chitinophaga nivalis]|uniref:MFS transporter n=1 Tax=Chitinophaga nivalis TaxID=2991709 RepID=A0ABT3IJD0_9BACT|nr:MFS transporter [Chitinophaga nivalis]MCW3466283.1 MFS transporter [Chitinophaga nivalis]MCW3484026.1 MFS transporter [Chitinophaga nivalis]